MAGNTSGRPWAVWPGGEHGDFRSPGRQAKIAHGIWFSGPQQTENQMEAGAS